MATVCTVKCRQSNARAHAYRRHAHLGRLTRWQCFQSRCLWVSGPPSPCLCRRSPLTVDWPCAHCTATTSTQHTHLKERAAILIQFWSRFWLQGMHMCHWAEFSRFSSQSARGPFSVSTQRLVFLHSLLWSILCVQSELVFLHSPGGKQTQGHRLSNTFQPINIDLGSLKGEVDIDWLISTTFCQSELTTAMTNHN